MRLTTLLTLIFFTAPSAAQTADGDLATLAAWLTGSFSSSEQAAEDDAFYDIRLRMAPIWTDRKDGHWLYVEQATAARQDQPYRQRVYRVFEREPGVFVSEVYTLAEPLQHAGCWRETQPLAGLSPADLSEREGCAVVMRREGEVFVGGTQGTDCASSLRGASYATSEITMHADKIVTWDRGYDEAGQQVWGAEKGGYVFKKLSQDPKAE